MSGIAIFRAGLEVRSGRRAAFVNRPARFIMKRDRCNSVSLPRSESAEQGFADASTHQYFPRHQTDIGMFRFGMAVARCRVATQSVRGRRAHFSGLKIGSVFPATIVRCLVCGENINAPFEPLHGSSTTTGARNAIWTDGGLPESLALAPPVSRSVPGYLCADQDVGRAGIRSCVADRTPLHRRRLQPLDPADGRGDRGADPAHPHRLVHPADALAPPSAGGGRRRQCRYRLQRAFRLRRGTGLFVPQVQGFWPGARDARAVSTRPWTSTSACTSRNA